MPRREEWFTYAGEPFHFRIAVGTEVTQTSIKEFFGFRPPESQVYHQTRIPDPPIYKHAAHGQNISYFRISVGTEVTQTSIKEFLKYLNQVKNARSRFDYMVFQKGL